MKKCIYRYRDVARYIKFLFAKVNGETCDIVVEAIERYTRIILTEARIARLAVEGQPRRFVRDDPHFKGILESLSIRLLQPCNNAEYWPHLNMNESCKFAVSKVHC